MSIKVEVRNNNVEQALRVLKRKVQKAGIIKDYRDRQYYKKPSEIKRERKNLAILRNRYKNQKETKEY